MNSCNILSHELVCAWLLWINKQIQILILDVTCFAVNFLFVCVRVGFRGHVETNSLFPPFPSHLPLTHWCLPGASGLWLWL